MNTETQAADVRAVYNGAQNFAIVEYRKAPKTFNALLAAGLESSDDRFEIRYLRGSEGPEIVVARLGFYGAYVDLLDARAGYKRHEFQIALGTLIGYDHASCQAFARDPVECSCSKCGGVETAADVLERNAWKGRTLENVRR
jgi:hypothetical protein